MAFSTMALKPDAKDVLVISMGCGHTAGAFTGFPINSLDIVDISKGAFEAAEYFPTNGGVLNDPRVTTIVQDGRNYLLTTRKKYDIIQLEPPSIHTDGVVNLYTREFYEIARSRLKQGGVLSQWIDRYQSGPQTTRIMVNTMLSVFPNAASWKQPWSRWINGVKGNQPVVLNRSKFEPLFGHVSVKKELASVHSSVEDVIARMDISNGALTEWAKGNGLITDDKTVVDFRVPKQNNPTAMGGGVMYYNSPMRRLFKQHLDLRLNATD